MKEKGNLSGSTPLKWDDSEGEYTIEMKFKSGQSSHDKIEFEESTPCLSDTNMYLEKWYEQGGHGFHNELVESEGAVWDWFKW